MEVLNIPFQDAAKIKFPSLKNTGKSLRALCNSI